MIDFMESQIMRTTLNIDDDVFNVAKQKAQRDNVSIGATVSELMRLGIRSTQMPALQRPITRSKYAVLPVRNEIITSEHVYKLMQQKGI